MTFNAATWNAANNYVIQIINYVVIFCLARILTPNDFGLIAMLIALQGFGIIIQDFGINSALIRKANASKIFYNSCFSFSVLIGLLLFCLSYFSSDLIAKFYNQPRLATLNKALSIVYLFNVYIFSHYAYLKKHFKFKKIFQIDIISYVLATVIALVFALVYKSIWSFIIQLILIGFFRCLFLIGKREYKFELCFSLNEKKEILKYSVPLFGSKSLFYWSNFLDNVLIGRYYGGDSVAFYSQSNQLVDFSAHSISSIINQVLLPLFARLQHNLDDIKKTYLKVIEFLAVFAIPICSIFFYMSREIVLILFGADWVDMVPILKILAVYGIIKSFSIPNGNIFMVLDKTKLQFSINFITRSILIVFIILAIDKGIYVIAYVKMVGIIFANIVSFYFIISILKIKYSKLLKIISLPILLNISLIILMNIFDFYFQFESLILSFGLKLILAGFAYLLLLKLFHKEAFKVLLSIIGDIKNRVSL